VLGVALLWAAPAAAQGLLVPKDGSIPPLALVSHQVEVTIDEQVSVTQVTQVFHNSSDRALEATYVFPVPKGASVDQFSMWVNGKEEKGELVEADKARTIYTDIVRRTQDPGLLEYVGQDVLQVRVFPVPARGEQKLSLRFSAVCGRDEGLVEYVYPLRSKDKDKSGRQADSFRLTAKLKSKSALQNVYSPTHSVSVKPNGDHEVVVTLEGDKANGDKDFHLYYALGNKDVGLTALAYRPDGEQPGEVMLMLSPRAELGKDQQIPRDMVFVLDTSGSMAGVKMEQAKKALKFCLNSLKPGDRFAMINFASTVNRYSDGLQSVGSGDLVKARKWVDALEATGGTAIDEALKAALDYRHSGGERSFTIVFFTDGMPTVGETNPETILKHVMDRNTAGTRIFTFGVGDDVNTVLLDKLAEQTRAVSTYVRPEEDIEAKVSGLYAKISHPVLTELKLTTGSNVTLSEVYPNHLPDLFHGGQVVVLARYQGKGHATVTLTGKVGAETKEFVYEIDFPGHTGKDRAFVEGLWARRKVGFLLEEIRANGEKKELVDEVVKLAKKHGITTPYTSYLCVPDAAPRAPVASAPVAPLAPRQPNHPTPRPMSGPVPISATRAMSAGGSGSVAVPTNGTTFAPSYESHGYQNYAMTPPGAQPSLTTAPGGYPSTPHSALVRPASPAPVAGPPADAAFCTNAPAPMGSATVNTGKEGVDLALELKSLREQDRVSETTTCEAAGRICVRVNDGWVDQAYDGKMAVVKVQAMKTAYFELLAKHPELKEVFQLGTRVAWVTPSGTVLMIDPDAGAETLSAEEMDKLFVKS
jgi:Ca-activated chloride channel family protein